MKLIESFKILKDKFSDDPQMYKTLKTAEEVKTFKKTIAESNNYLEFGSGGSTFDALKYSRATIYSVESSKAWIKHMLSWKFIKKYNKNKRLNFIHVNIGETKDWGKPLNDKKRDLFPNYSGVLNDSIINRKIDTILVDGRFRVACILNAILNCNKDIILLMHDFWSREHYHIVLNYLDTVCKVDNLGVFKIKKIVDIEEIKKLYDKYKYIPN